MAMRALILAAIAAVTTAAKVHPERLTQIEMINNATSLWTASPQARFAAHPVGVSKSLCGVIGDMGVEINKGLDAGEIDMFMPINPDMAIPDAFDSATGFPACAKIIDDIRDQSNCGCCWAFAGAEAASDRMCIATNASMMVPISAEEVCFCSNPNGCDGGQINTPWTYIKNRGAVTGGQYEGSGPFGNSSCSDFSLPHCHHHGPQGNDPYPAEGKPGCESQTSAKCPKACDAGKPNKEADSKYTFKGSVQTAQGEKGIQQMIMEGGPVETAFTVYSDFENYAGGVYKHTTGQQMGGHAVKFVGWGVDAGTKYWKVANSWNPYWGEKGYFRIVRGTSEGGIEDGVTGSSADATWAKKQPWN